MLSLRQLVSLHREASCLGDKQKINHNQHAHPPSFSLVWQDRSEEHIFWAVDGEKGGSAVRVTWSRGLEDGHVGRGVNMRMDK
jgi:hypothetical protein